MKKVITYGLIALAAGTALYYGYKWYKKSKSGVATVPPNRSVKPELIVTTTSTGTGAGQANVSAVGNPSVGGVPSV